MGAIIGVLGAASDSDLREGARSIAHRGKRILFRRYADDLAVAAIGTDPGASVFASDHLVVVCDAMIYNSADIIAHLRQKGVPLVSATPAAIIHALYSNEGPESLERVNGDYAFALIDRQSNQAVFGRDFLGVRPLHYTVLPFGSLAFSSEYKGLLQLSGMRPEIDRDMVQHLQCAKSLPVGRTLLANVFEVPPCGTVRLNRSGVILARAELSSLGVEPSVVDEAEATDLACRTLRQAVRRRSQDLDRIGLALSGGIDSAATAFLLRELYPERIIHTFTAGDGPGNPEMVRARRVANAIGAAHHEVITPPDLVKDQLYPLAWCLEDPIARSEALQLYWVARTARAYVDVLIHCDGADGLFAGMPRHRLLWLMAKLPPARGPLRDFYHLTQLSLPPRSLLGKALDRAYNRGRVPRVPAVLGARMPEPAALPPVSPEFVNICCARMYGLGRRGQKYERTFGAWGLEARSPFYDPELCREAFRITDRLKLHGRTNKYILRKSAARFVPEEFLKVPKFPQRMTYDVMFANALDDVAASVLSQEAVQARGLFSPEGIRKLLRRRANRPYPAEAAMRLWTAVLTECWAQQFIDRGRALQRSSEARQGRETGPSPHLGGRMSVLTGALVCDSRRT